MFNNTGLSSHSLWGGKIHSLSVYGVPWGNLLLVVLLFVDCNGKEQGYQRTMVDPMCMIVQNLGLFLSAVTTNCCPTNCSYFVK